MSNESAYLLVEFDSGADWDGAVYNRQFRVEVFDVVLNDFDEPFFVGDWNANMHHVDFGTGWGSCCLAFFHFGFIKIYAVENEFLAFSKDSVKGASYFSETNDEYSLHSFHLDS